MHRYWVVSPVYAYEETIDYYIGGPMVETRDSICVVARTKREAIVKGVARMRSPEFRKSIGYVGGVHYFGNGWEGDTPPWKGFKAELDYCQHDLEVDGEHLCAVCETRMEDEDALARLAAL